MSRRNKRKRIENISNSDSELAIRNSAFNPGIGMGIGGGINPLGYPGNQAPWWSNQISQPTTEFINLRWYLISNMRQFLSELYVEIGTVQTIVNVPVDDALRGGVEIKSQQLDEDQIKTLLNSLDRDDDITTIGQAAKWNRLFGGAGILIFTDQDPEEPLDLESIDQNTPLAFRAVDMWELFWDKQNSEGYDPAIQSVEFDYYNYYGEQVHKSRVMRLKGLSAPSFIRPRLRGWGFSVAEALVRSLNQYLKSQSLTFEVLDEFKLDIYKIKNLVNTLLSPQASQKIRERVQQSNYMKNYQNAIVMDSEDDYAQKQLSFTGLAETMSEIRIQLAADMRMPITKLFGISSAGFNSGEDDIENYNAMVESEVRNKIKYDILRVCEIKCKKLFGFIPDDLSIAFKPLRVMSSEQEENVKTQKFNRLAQSMSNGWINIKEFRQAVNKGNLLDITLDPDEDDLGGYMSDKISEGENNPYDPQDIDNPGADRLDTRKSRATEVGGAGQEPPTSEQQPAPRSTDEPRNIAQITKNAKEFDETKHPRDEDGKFGEKSGGGRSTKGKDKKPQKEVKPSQSFKGFSLKDPERLNMKTPDLSYICVGGKSAGGRGDLGMPSAIPYKSPQGSTCNLVGYVALGKSSQKMQKHFVEVIQSSEVILTEMGIRFKSPIDFVSQAVNNEKYTQALFIRYQKANNRINIKGKSHFYAKSVLHEIGHAIDYAMNNQHVSASAKHKYGSDHEDLKKLHKDLSDIVTSSDFYKDAPDIKFKMYLSEPTEVFARGFEVYAYAKGLELVKQGKLPTSFIENFRPDIFKTKNQKMSELLDISNKAVEKANSMIFSIKHTSDPTKKEELREQWRKLKEKALELSKEYEAAKNEVKGSDLVPQEKQEEYMSKISSLMSEIFKKEPLKNAIMNLELANESNSAQFDRASYEADGGDKWIDERRKYFFENPIGVDKSLWERAKEASKSAYGKIKWQFTLWFYKKHGGRFG